MPRKYGERPKKMGNYEMVAPTEKSDNLLKLIGGQKMFGSVMKVSHKNTDISTLKKNINKNNAELSAIKSNR